MPDFKGQHVKAADKDIKAGPGCAKKNGHPPLVVDLFSGKPKDLAQTPVNHLVPGGFQLLLVGVVVGFPYPQSTLLAGDLRTAHRRNKQKGCLASETEDPLIRSTLVCELSNDLTQTFSRVHTKETEACLAGSQQGMRQCPQNQPSLKASFEGILPKPALIPNTPTRNVIPYRTRRGLQKSGRVPPKIGWSRSLGLRYPLHPLAALLLKPSGKDQLGLKNSNSSVSLLEPADVFVVLRM